MIARVTRKVNSFSIDRRRQRLIPSIDLSKVPVHDQRRTQGCQGLVIRERRELVDNEVRIKCEFAQLARFKRDKSVGNLKVHFGVIGLWVLAAISRATSLATCQSASSGLPHTVVAR